MSRDTIILAFVCTIDLLSTAYCVSLGLACEGNPLMAMFANMGTTQLIIAKFVSFTPYLVLIERYRTSKPRNARILTRMVTYIYLLAYVCGTLHLNLSA